MSQTKIAVIVGSLRKDSFNRKLATGLAKLAPAGFEFHVIEIGDLPLYNQDEDGTPVAEICRKAGISQATYFNWKKKYAGLLPTEMKRLKQLEEENGRLKKIAADLTLDPEMLQD